MVLANPIEVLSLLKEPEFMLATGTRVEVVGRGHSFLKEAMQFLLHLSLKGAASSLLVASPSRKRKFAANKKLQ